MFNHCFSAMTVPCQLLLTGEDDNLLASVAHRVELNTKRLEQKYNFYAQDSWLNSVINRRALSAIALDQETAQVLSLVRRLSEDTLGCFDITVGTFKQLAKLRPDLSYQQLFELSAENMGLTSWRLDGHILTFRSSATQVDLGGVIKEYAVDQAALICRQQGITGGLINFGGDIISWGKKDDGENFRVAIANPKQAGQVLCTIPLQDQALATSGHNERSLLVQQQQVSHILADKGISKSVLSASVISHSTLISGIYSTVLTIAPELELPRTVAPLFVDSSLSLHQNTDFLR